MDSEFIGADSQHHEHKRELLAAIARRFPQLRFKIYARTDTLMSFNQFSLLKTAGLVQVFMGVESLFQPDLDALRKSLTVQTLTQCIERIRDLGIYLNLSFITFNRNTTVASLRENINVLRQLFGKRARFLGMPNFTFSFETDWIGRSETGDQLSTQTYVWKDLDQKMQAGHQPCFEIKLEPLMEIYRLSYSYEWSKKITQSNLARPLASLAEQRRIDDWFERLAAFCLDTMELYLGRYERGDLTIATLPDHNALPFEDIREFYNLLPQPFRALATFEFHASQIDYATEVTKLEREEHWDDAVPAVS